MNHSFFTNLIFALGGISCCFSWWYFKKNAFKLALFLLIVGGFMLRLYSASDLFLHEWDERFHALVAKNLIQHPLKPTLYDPPALPYNYSYWWANHIWLHKQPLPLWFMAVSMDLFGINEWALRLPSVLLSTMGIALTFYICAHLLNRSAAYFAAFLYAINGFILEITGGRIATDHVDVAFLFFIELAVFFTIVFIKKKKLPYLLLTGISMGAAMLSKWLPALIVLPVCLFILLDSKTIKTQKLLVYLLLILLVAAVIFIPWQLYIYSAFPLEARWERQLNLRHFTETLDGQGGSLFYYLNKIRINYGELIYLPLGWYAWILARNRNDYRKMAVFLWFFIPFLFFSLAKTKMQGYLLFTAPALFIITADFREFILRYVYPVDLKWAKTLILLLLVGLPVRYAVERLKPFSYDKNPAWVSALKKAPAINNAILFNYPRPIDAMFYTNYTAYEHLPEEEALKQLIKEGYTILVNKNGKLPAPEFSIPGVNYVQLPLPD